LDFSVKKTIFLEGKKMKKKLLIGLCMVILLLSGCGTKETGGNVNTKENLTQKDNNQKETTIAPLVIGETGGTTDSAESNSYHQEDMVKSKLTGEWVDKKVGNRRPIAVMLNNIKEAIPQSAIEAADIVYEAPVEGGITRLMGIFENFDDLDKIGSVRSSRLYYCYFAKEFDAVYVHWGQAIYAQDLLNSSNIDNLNGLDLEGSTFFRSSDRVAPHNGYTSGERLLAGIEKKGYRSDYRSDYQQKFTFTSSEVTLSDGITANKVTPGYSVNRPWFEYQESDGLYYRYQYGDKQIDGETGNQLAYKNIIMQNVDYYDYGDGYYYIYTSGRGSGKYITNGKAIDITWRKDTEFGVTKYYDLSGNEIELNPGKTWVCIIQNSGNISIE